MNFIVKNRSISCQPQLVIGDNKDYLAEFEFDSEWTSTKTARFETANGHVDVILQNDKCTIPVEVLKKGVLKVGVFDSTKTTTCCEVVVRGSIKEQDGDVIPPTEDVYAQLTEALDGKQEALVSGTNIKTVNGTSLLGVGNIEIEGGGAEIDDTTASTTKTYSSQKIEVLFSPPPQI